MMIIANRLKHIDIFNFLYTIILSIGFVICLHLYFNYIDREAHRFAMGTDDSFVATSESENDKGLYILNIKEDLSKFINGKKSISSVTYKVKGESFYLDVEIKKDKFNIKKIVDTSHNLNARIDYDDVETIEYRTGGLNKATLLKINSSNNSKYLAITNDAYYFLGSDIDEIGYENDRFCYYMYNNKYDSLRTASVCSDKIKNAIEDFDYNEYYYKKGTINFLKDFYQKLKSQNHSVKEYCNELKNQK